MRIALQTSGGRGEYELTGSYGAVGAADLLNDDLSFELWPGHVIAGLSAVRRAQGKLRIRLASGVGAQHAYRVLSNALLLPEPIRERAKTTNQVPFVLTRQYAVTDVDVDLTQRSAGAAVLRPSRMWLQNRVGDVARIDFAERMAVVQLVWDAARMGAAPLDVALQDHESAASSGDHGKIAAAAADVRRRSKTDADVLPHLAANYGLGLLIPAGGIPVTHVSDDGIQDDIAPAEARKKTVMVYRRVAERGAAGRRFAATVRSAYNYTCAFCGVRFPKLDSTATAGVDGAHILPWAKFDLNSVINGLCLCKRCHWAFDNGVIRLDYIAAPKRYRLSIPKEVKAEAKSEGFLLGWFENNVVGNIPPAYLPTDKALWPQPTYIAQLNAELYP